MDPQPHAPRGPLVQRDPIRPADPIRPTCKATNNRGQRCKYPPIPGGTVCRFHGGNAPQVRAKAEERLASLLHPAVIRLGELVEQTEFPSVAIAAVKDVLDRNLGKAVESMKVTGGDGGPLQIIINAPWRNPPKP